MAATMRCALEQTIVKHPYDAAHQTCQCVLDRATQDDQIAPITRQQHATHVTNLILGLLEGGTVLGTKAA